MPIAQVGAGVDPTLVSIIVPIYNAEQWLPACLDSVLAQTYGAWEAVLVIDGSPDGSETVARRYAQRDSRFRVIVTPNGGPGAARNAGLERARGGYITFLDSDDRLEREAIGMLVAALEGSEAEMAGGIIYDFFPDPKRRPRYWTMRGPQFSRRWATYQLRDMPSLIEDSIVCAKLFRRSLVERIGLQFPEHTQVEDIVPALQLELATRATAIVPAEIYAHRRHEAAISADYLRERTLRDWLRQATRTLRLIEQVEDDRVRDHYILKHTFAQWWTRAERFALIDDPELLAGVEGLAADMLATAVGWPDAMDVLRTRVLRFFAAGGPSRRWLPLSAELRAEHHARSDPQSLAVSPLEAPRPERGDLIAEAAVRAFDALDLGDPDEAALGAELLVCQVLAPACRGWVEQQVIVQEAIDRLHALAPEALHSITLPAIELGADATSSAADLARLAWRALEGRAATLCSIRLEPRGLVLRGRVELTRPIDAEDVFRLSLTEWASREQRWVPVTMASPLAVPGPTPWQAVIPAAMLATLHEAELRLRRTSRHGRAIELLIDPEPGQPTRLEAHAPDRSEIVTAAFGPGPRPCVTGGARSAPTAQQPVAQRPRNRVFTFPNWGSNPYMAMLQTEVRGSGALMPGTTDHHQLVRELQDRAAWGPVHIHWTSPITEKARDEKDAEQRVDEVLNGLRAAKSGGRPILWTVHNVLPHDTRFPAAAIRLHQGIADIADIIHVLATTTQEAIGALYRLPEEKLRVLPHSSYSGVYGSRLPRDIARADIGSSADTTQVLFFGQLRPYKGLEHLFEAAAQLQPTPHRVELLLAGNPTPGLREQVQRLEETDVAVTSALRFIEDSEVAAWFSAADVAVLPYQRILNSGTMHLAATFGLPVLLPDEHTITADFGDEAWLRFFDASDPVPSIRRHLEDGWYRDPAVREAALAYARRRSPYAMARAYADLIDEVTGAIRR